MKKFFVPVEELYGRVNASLPRFEGNPCGDCRSCCTAANMHSHQVSRLEFAYLAHHAGQEKADLFERYIRRERDTRGELVFPQCPMLNEFGCSVHRYRPLSCRYYGHFQAEGTEMIAHCVFKGKAKILPADQQRALLPGSAEMTDLAVEYASYFPAQDSDANSLGGREPETEVERVRKEMAEGNYQSALERLRPLTEKESSVALCEMMGGCYRGLGDFPRAVEWFEKACQLSDDNPQLLYQLAGCQFSVGDLDSARGTLERALEMAPERANAKCLLGSIHLMQNNLVEAEHFLREGLAGDSKPGPYHFQLALAQHCLDMVDQAVANYRLALRFEGTREQATVSLNALGLSG